MSIRTLNMLQVIYIYIYIYIYICIYVYLTNAYSCIHVCGNYESTHTCKEYLNLSMHSMRRWAPMVYAAYSKSWISSECMCANESMYVVLRMSQRRLWQMACLSAYLSVKSRLACIYTWHFDAHPVLLNSQVAHGLLVSGCRYDVYACRVWRVLCTAGLRLNTSCPRLSRQRPHCEHASKRVSACWWPLSTRNVNGMQSCWPATIVFVSYQNAYVCALSA